MGGNFIHVGDRPVGAWGKPINQGWTERAVHKGHATWNGPLCTASIGFHHWQVPQPTVVCSRYSTSGGCQGLFLGGCRLGFLRLLGDFLLGEGAVEGSDAFRSLGAGFQPFWVVMVNS